MLWQPGSDESKCQLPRPSLVIFCPLGLIYEQRLYNNDDRENGWKWGRKARGREGEIYLERKRWGGRVQSRRWEYGEYGDALQAPQSDLRGKCLHSMKWMLTSFTLVPLRIITTSQQFVTRGLEILNPSRSTMTMTDTMTIFIFLLLIMTDQFVTRGLAILGPSSSLPSSLSSPPSSSSSLSLKYLAAFLPETNLRDFWLVWWHIVHRESSDPECCDTVAWAQW